MRAICVIRHLSREVSALVPPFFAILLCDLPCKPGFVVPIGRCKHMCVVTVHRIALPHNLFAARHPVIHVREWYGGLPWCLFDVPTMFGATAM